MTTFLSPGPNYCLPVLVPTDIPAVGRHCPVRQLLALVLLLVLLGAAGRVQAQATVPFSCDGAFYQVRANNVATASDFYRIRRGTTFSEVKQYNIPVVLNCLAFNKADGYYYALQKVANGAAASVYKLGQTGYTNLGPVASLPTFYYSAGVIDGNGTYYVQRGTNPAGGTTNGLLQKITITPAAAAGGASTLSYGGSLQMRQSGNAFDPIAFGDLAYNPINNLLYNVGFADYYYTINPSALAGTNNTSTYGNETTRTTGVGSAFFDALGNFYVYGNGTVGTANSGSFYLISPTTASFSKTLINNATPTGESDGASCAFPDQRLDVVQELTSVVPFSAGVFDITYTVRVNNPGSIDAPNVQVTAFGGPGAGTSFPGATSVSAPVAVVVSGGLPGTAANASFTGTGDNSGIPYTANLLDGDATLGFGQSATITYTLRVTYPTNSVPGTAQQNTVYATTTSNSPNIGYRNIGGTLVPPPDLLAADASTNGAIFPVNSNADTPSPTPVTFTRAIYGTVFEDVNYGGGAGRSQGASQGVGRGNVRVELYTVTAGVATYTTATNTSAVVGSVGEYAFTAPTTVLTSGGKYIVRVVNSSVTSSRPGSTAVLRGVQTYVYNDVNRVGGENPNREDAGDGSGSVAITALTVSAPAGGTFGSIAQSQAQVTLSDIAASPAVNVDFGFNFDAVVNTNNSGQGSLRQFIINSNTLTNAGLAQAGLPVGKEYALFMLSDGIASGNGLRSSVKSTNYSLKDKTFTISPFALPEISDDNTAVDGKLQSNQTGENVGVTSNTTGAEVVLDFSTSTQGGFTVTGANTRIASVNVKNAGVAAGSRSLNLTPTLADGAAIVVSGAGTTGTVITDITGQNNTIATVLLQGGATGVTVSRSVLRAARSVAAVANVSTANDGAGIILSNASGNTITDNVINDNNGYGIELTGAGTNSSDGNTISLNKIGTNGGGTNASKDAGISITLGNNNLISGNTISGSSGDAIVALPGTSGNRFTQNVTDANATTGGNGQLAIDLSAINNLNGDDVSLNANGKTAGSGANGLLNFPVFTQATVNGGKLYVTGYVKAGALLELFVASADPSKFGEGVKYLFSATEGSALDTDPRTANYNSVNGLPANSPTQGSETGVNRFTFAIAISGTDAASLASNKLTATATVLNTVNGLEVGNTSEFSALIAVLNNNTPLPVELSEFTAKALNNADARLDWRTASEKNNDHFDVERSLNGTDFVQIGQVRGQGMSSTPTAYALTDAGIGPKAQKLVYYRLKQVDTDGTATYSPVRTVTFTKTATAASIGLWPNPATGSTLLDLSLMPTGSYEMNVLDATGRVVLRAVREASQPQALDLSTLASGFYLVRVSGQSLTLTKRLIKE